MYKINRRSFLRNGLKGLAALSIAGFECSRVDKKKYPNIILIMTDDQGYADTGIYGATDFKTPNLDQMATEGIRFTDYYTGSPVCTPSRAALLTGCFAQRIGLPDVIGPKGPGWTDKRWNIGLSSTETTVASMLKKKGYATACIGKWHLGHLNPFLPTKHGFDEYFGLPYSNDMWSEYGSNWPALPLMEGENVLEMNPDQSRLTTRYTERALKFISENKDGPFFLYLPHTMPHIPLYVSDKFKGKSDNGLYGDVIMEIDWSVGEILKTLKHNHLDENTFVIFISDNGPWLTFGNYGGSAGLLREGKFTTFDGGQRVPCIMRWPGTIPAGTVSNEIISAIDFLPTFASLTGSALPAKTIDGMNVYDAFIGKKSPRDTYYFYRGMELEAIRYKNWKLHLPHQYHRVTAPGMDGKNGKHEMTSLPLSLFDLSNDLGEKNNIAAQYPDIVSQLKAMADKYDKELKTELRACGKLVV